MGVITNFEEVSYTDKSELAESRFEVFIVPKSFYLINFLPFCLRLRILNLGSFEIMNVELIELQGSCCLLSREESGTLLIGGNFLYLEIPSLLLYTSLFKLCCNVLSCHAHKEPCLLSLVIGKNVKEQFCDLMTSGVRNFGLTWVT